MRSGSPIGVAVYRDTEEGFISESHEIYRALRISRVTVYRDIRTLFPGWPLRFVGDAGLDDEKIFRWVVQSQAQFIFRVRHRERLVEIYNPRRHCWEQEALGDLANTVPYTARWRVTFGPAHQTRETQVHVGWFAIRLPKEPTLPLWVLVADDPAMDRQLILITNVPLQDEQVAWNVYSEWRYRPRIGHTYRFDQERGLDVEDICVHTLERIRRLFLLVLLGTLFTYHVAQTWPQDADVWLRHLGGKLDLNLDADGPYILLAGISAVFVAAATLTFSFRYPFPSWNRTYG